MMELMRNSCNKWLMMKEERGFKERLWEIKKEEEEAEQQPWLSVFIGVLLQALLGYE